MTRITENPSDRLVGMILLISSALTVVTMSHHPSGHGGSLGLVVHGVMIVLFCTMFFGFCYYSLRRGLDRLLVLAALVAYLLNFFSHIIAGNINGFLVPALAEHGQDIPHAIFLFAWESNHGISSVSA